MSDAEHNKLSYLDFEGLCKACVKLTVKSKDKKLDVSFEVASSPWWVQSTCIWTLRSHTLGERLP